MDSYATRLQELEVARREADVDYEEAKAERATLLNRIVEEGNADKAQLLADLTCPCGEPARPRTPYEERKRSPGSGGPEDSDADGRGGDG